MHAPVGISTFGHRGGAVVCSSGPVEGPGARCQLPRWRHHVRATSAVAARQDQLANRRQAFAGRNVLPQGLPPARFWSRPLGWGSLVGRGILRRICQRSPARLSNRVQEIITRPSHRDEESRQSDTQDGKGAQRHLWQRRQQPSATALPWPHTSRPRFGGAGGAGNAHMFW